MHLHLLEVMLVALVVLVLVVYLLGEHVQTLVVTQAFTIAKFLKRVLL